MLSNLAKAINQNQRRQALRTSNRYLTISAQEFSKTTEPTPDQIAAFQEFQTLLTKSPNDHIKLNNAIKKLKGLQDAKNFLKGLPAEHITAKIGQTSPQQPKILHDRKYNELLGRVEKNEMLSAREYRVLSVRLSAEGDSGVASLFSNTTDEEQLRKLYEEYDLDLSMPRINKSQTQLEVAKAEQWKLQQMHDAETETLRKLNMYNYSEQMVQAIAQRLTSSESAEQMAYIKSKLELGNNEFSKYMAQGFSNEPKLDLDSALNNTANKRAQPKKIVDTFNLGSRVAPHNQYQPANPQDQFQHHRDREIKTLEEYTFFREAEMQDQATRKTFNSYFDTLDPNYATYTTDTEREEEQKDKDNLEDDDEGVSSAKAAKEKDQIADDDEKSEEEEEPKAAAADEQITKSDEEHIEEELDNYLYKDPYETSDSERTDQEKEQAKRDLAFLRKIRDFRAAVAAEKGSPNPVDSHRYEKISNDAGNDPIAKLEARLRQKVIFDQDAIFKQKGYKHAKYFDNENQAKIRHLQRSLERSEEVRKNYTDLLDLEYAQGRKYRLENQRQRVAIADEFRNLQVELQQLKDQHKELVGNMVDCQKMNPERHAMPKKLFDFIKQEKSHTLDAKEQARRLEHELIEQLRAAKPFTGTETDPQAYERELQLVSRSALSKPESVKHFSTLFNLIDQNNIEKTDAIRARMFEYATLTGAFDVANAQLAKLSADPTFNQIDKEYLKRYFRTCLAADSYDGIAYLVNYCESHGVDVSDMDVNRFRETLDSYVNADFNVSKIMVFAKFYVYQNKCKLSRALRAGLVTDFDSEQGKHLMSQALFGDNKALVDMRSVLDYTVQQVGTQSLMDPLTREDALWNIIDFYTRPEVIGASQQSINDKVSPLTVANFLGNNMKKANTLDRMIRVALRYDNLSSQEGQQFVNEMLKEISTYQGKHHGSLPDSFSEEAIRDIYLKLSDPKVKLSQPTKELVLHLLKAKGLNNEVFDFANRQEQSELTDYYKSEAILNMKLKQGKTYSETLNEVLPKGKTACKLIQKVKALYRDNNLAGAVDYFNRGVKQLQNKVDVNDEVYEKMYDELFGTAKNDISLHEFAALHLKSAISEAKLRRDGHMVGKIKELLEGKDYNDIEQCMSLFTVLNEEQAFMAKYGVNDKLDCHDLMLSGSLKLQLDSIRERKDLLLQEFKNQDIIRVQELVSDLAQDKKTLDLSPEIVEMVEATDELFSFDNYKNTKELLEQQEALESELEFFNQYQEGSETLFAPSTEQKVAIGRFDQQFMDNDSEQELENSDYTEDSDGQEKNNFSIIKEFKDGRAAMYEDLMNEFIDDDYQGDRETQLWLDNNIHDRVNRLAKHKNQINEFYSDEEFDLRQFNQYKEYMFDGAINSSDESDEDPEGFAADAHDHGIFEAREELLFAFKDRKTSVLQKAIKLFSAVQAKTVTMNKLDIEDIQKVSVAETLHRAEYILNDHRSPIISGLLQTEKYASIMPANVDEFYDAQGRDKITDPIDIDMYQRDYEKLENLSEHIFSLRAVIEQSKEKLKEANREMKSRDRPHVSDLYQVEQLYEQWKAQQGKQKSAASKVAFIKEAIAIKFGTTMTHESIPVFYALDLVQFGIKHKCADALRIGEHLLSEGGHKMPLELQHQVKDYMLQKANNADYNAAMARQGPISNTMLYHASSREEAGAAPIFCIDDPYWQDFMARNSRREDRWRSPSILAWNHKPYGIVGEVIDVQKMQKEYERYRDI